MKYFVLIPVTLVFLFCVASSVADGDDHQCCGFDAGDEFVDSCGSEISVCEAGYFAQMNTSGCFQGCTKCGNDTFTAGYNNCTECFSCDECNGEGDHGSCAEQCNKMIPIHCSQVPEKFKNGNVTCTNSNMPESKCKVECNEGYKGSETTTCKEDGEWDDGLPKCEAEDDDDFPLLMVIIIAAAGGVCLLVVLIVLIGFFKKHNVLCFSSYKKAPTEDPKKSGDSEKAAEMEPVIT